MHSGNVSRIGNRYAQVYLTEFGLSRSHPIKKNVDAHENLSIFFKINGVPPKMVMYGSKEQTLGSFRKKCQEEDCYINQTDKYSPWKLQSEGNIR